MAQTPCLNKATLELLWAGWWWRCILFVN